jgi:hypothetical protein
MSVVSPNPSLGGFRGTEIAAQKSAGRRRGFQVDFKQSVLGDDWATESITDTAPNCVAGFSAGL